MKHGIKKESIYRDIKAPDTIAAINLCFKYELIAQTL